MHAPLLLGRICKQWRDITYNTAEFWSAVHVVIPWASQPKRRRLKFDAFKGWLSRSGDHPLCISLYVSCESYCNESDLNGWFSQPFCDHASDLTTDTPAFLNLLIPHSARWEHIVLVLPHACYPILDH